MALHHALLTALLIGGSSCGKLAGPTLPDAKACNSLEGVTWVVTGLDSVVEAPPATELWRATLRVGDEASLRLSTRGRPECGDTIATVSWQSSAPEVASVQAAASTVEARLTAIAEGEARVTARVGTLAGATQVAELWASPPGSSRLLRLHGVRVVR
jgi:hypothetical protein